MIAAIFEGEDCAVHGFILPNSVVAVTASDKSLDTVWFTKVVVSCKEPTNSVIDDYGHTIPVGTAFMEGHFLEKNETFKSSAVYNVSKKETFFINKRSCIPMLNLLKTSKGLFYKTNIWLIWFVMLSIMSSPICKILLY